LNKQVSKVIRSTLAIIGGIVIVLSLFASWQIINDQKVNGLLMRSVQKSQIIKVLLDFLVLFAILIILGGIFGLFEIMISAKIVSISSFCVIICTIAIILFLTSSTSYTIIDVGPWVTFFGALISLTSLRL